ncbi:corticosteroid-binding globulin [Peromyscus californicus insignis]|uniref:corticosteroid-binding globulin n=1 Tax=Peromyscus californicus insignis TaxID=564181 RepID=UPI0022A774A6|nr:corticosteroid-binding globulin [Peromyscus californicus insignis]
MPLALHTCLLWLSASVLMTAHTLNDSTAESSLSPHRGLAPTNVDFAFNLYHHLSTLEPHKNILISPVSVTTALAMMSLGTMGPTKTQLLQDVGFNLTEIPEDEIYQKFEQLSHLLSQSDSNLEMSMGNAMFLNKNLKLKDLFLTDIARYYKSEALTTNFNDWAEASKQINKHVESKTQGKITHVFSDQESPAALILVNYIFLKGMWELPLNPENTKDEDFHVNETSTVRVPMMFQSGNMDYLHDSKIPCQVLKMRYLGNGTTFFILPDQGQMDTVIAKLNRDTIERWDKLLTKRWVNLYIPKVSMSGTYDLEDALAGMGITDLFTSQSAFSNITEDSPLKPLKVVHKAMLQLDETGARHVVTREAPPIPEPLTITFNRPFTLLIFDDFTWSSLLFAKIMNPA